MTNPTPESGIRPVTDQPHIPTERYVEALVEPLTNRIRAGDVTLRQYLERVIEEHKQCVEKLLKEADRLERARIATLQTAMEERWQRVEEQVRNATMIAAESVDQLRRERELVTQAQREAATKAEQSVSQALDKAEIATDKRFESVNEFRVQQADIIARFITRDLAEAQFANIRSLIATLTEKVSKIA